MSKLIETAKNIPIFPLPDAYLFPHMIMPLRIYEERYLRMMADILRGDRYLVMAVLKPGWQHDYEETPVIQEIAGAGYISRTRMTRFGQLLISISGLARVRILAEHQHHPYRRGAVEVLFDKQRIQSRDLLRIVHNQLWDILTRTFDYLPDGGKKVRTLFDPRMPPWTLCNLAGAYVLQRDEPKHKLFSIVDPIERMNYLINLLQEYIEVGRFLRGGKTATPDRPWLN
ncbi:LON peptidase substrate-binding domain-containing protein [bacterium]|nr:LON peptidase substrate-binding domain-containing protein [candidate division CSSED10-310 bacterium]